MGVAHHSPYTIAPKEKKVYTCKSTGFLSAGHHESLLVAKGRQGSSRVIKGRQGSSRVIKGHQGSPSAISVTVEEVDSKGQSISLGVPISALQNPQ
jgi:hypothetical protein